MRIIACQNLKGGTGKTTTVLSLGSRYATLGYRVLILDMDPQGNIKESLDLEHSHTMFDLLVDDFSLEDCCCKARHNLDVVISDNTLAAVEMQLVSRPRREETLSMKMRGIEDYDYIFLDCSPSLSLINQNALLYAGEILIPISMDYLSMLGAVQVIDNLAEIRKYYERMINIAGILPTFFDPRTSISREVLSALRDVYGEKVLSPIRVDTRMKEASASRKTIFEYDRRSRSARDYAKVCEELTNGEITSENTKAKGRKTGTVLRTAV
jgi:chromosome partitioning protein